MIIPAHQHISLLHHPSTFKKKNGKFASQRTQRNFVLVNPSHNGSTARPWWPLANWPPHWRLGRTSRKGWINFLPTNSASTWNSGYYPFSGPECGKEVAVAVAKKLHIDYRRCVYICQECIIMNICRIILYIHICIPASANRVPTFQFPLG